LHRRHRSVDPSRPAVGVPVSGRTAKVHARPTSSLHLLNPPRNALLLISLLLLCLRLLTLLLVSRPVGLIGYLWDCIGIGFVAIVAVIVFIIVQGLTDDARLVI
jgi:hypothetical protein